MLITFLASYLIWVLVAGLVVLWVIDGPVKKEVALHAGIAFVLAFGVGEILKNIFQTQRPFIVEHLIPLTATIPHDGAFPSGHTASAVALAVTVWLHNRKIGALFIIIAVTIGVARVLANVHWPIDIAGGIIIGIAVALAVEKLHTFPLLKKRK